MGKQIFKKLFEDKELRNTRLMTVYDISDLVKIENNDYFLLKIFYRII